MTTRSSYNEIANQIHGADLLKGKFREAMNVLQRLVRTASVIKALSREARKRGDGTNPSVGIYRRVRDGSRNE